MKTILVIALALAFPCMALSEEIDFAHQIAPLLKKQCGTCHSGTQKEGGFSLNTRETLLAGGESGLPIAPRNGEQGELIARVMADDESTRMPPEGAPLTADQVKLLKRWVESGTSWEPGFTFGEKIYEPPLKPRRPELPPAIAGRTNPIDRILDAQLVLQNTAPLKPLNDEAFLRRVYLDLIGILPTPNEREAFLQDTSPDKRTRLIRELLARDVDYAEHWLTFWNDLLRNDYTGTGFITGGRKQISSWLYEALVTNKPYDQFTRELIAPPTPESAGFGQGIQWRGEVSAAQAVEIQFAQNVGQSFLGINLKCASCHDSFIDRWKLKEAYGLAAIYAQRSLELHRCDKPIGETAQASWLFPELGQVDPDAPQPKRLQQLAELMTHRENGRFTRTIVNRLWHRMMGRGIVHPTDAMQSPPWNADLLDFLAEHLVENNYDLKQTLLLIATSQAYQTQAERVSEQVEQASYQYAGPRSKRMTAEQFVDCVWQVTETSPSNFDAPVIRGSGATDSTSHVAISGQWIWNQADVSQTAAGETITLRKQFELSELPTAGFALVTCDNEFTLYVNGKKLASGNNWMEPELVRLTSLSKGTNEILIVAKNAGNGPNAAGLFFEARLDDQVISSDETWQWTAQIPKNTGKFEKQPEDWQPAAVTKAQDVWMSRLHPVMAQMLSQGIDGQRYMVRASLLKSDFLMRSLGRPNRDQVVSVRPLELTTLEAIDLSNGEVLANILRQGARQLSQREWESPHQFVSWLYHFALSRDPSDAELATLVDSLGPKMTTEAIEDVLWTVFMLPEFQLVH
ncbi:hypothetical protein C5Y96_02660 [Blastopirellula marina]|uniref:Cytochrome c domain-containing protein n=1 Tax=Blastopirellula marina TaxID=124 RepID=A0A2S8G2W8_9BACT|nr:MULTISPECIES: DUF1549 domain-containing protein [Pirellulaceae]PQO38788.1 hypothetical protein C5Y96_02660 [Blastopirellula marina]RCS55096.1 DUF1549 domain-containing protein [Bremerella cremea]